MLAALLPLSSCVFDEPALDGLLCSAEHLCRTGDACVGGVCLPQGDVPAAVAVDGTFQKGPFQRGSSIEVIGLDARGQPTGQIFPTETKSDLGDFTLPLNYRGLAELRAEGFYFNEVLGAASGAQLLLRGLYDVAGDTSQTARVNVVTHLGYDRALHLMTVQGSPAVPASAQAERELLAALQVGAPDGVPDDVAGTSMDLLGAGAADGWLLVLSAVVSQAAVTRAGGPGGSVDAAMQELLNTIADDLEDDGLLDPLVVAELDVAERDVDMVAVLAALQDRVGPGVTLPDVSGALDSDQDGLADGVDNCDFDDDPDQRDSDGDGVGDVCDCGNGEVDVGEDCDPPGPDCSLACRFSTLACEPGVPCDAGGVVGVCRAEGCVVDCGDPTVPDGTPCEDGGQCQGRVCDVGGGEGEGEGEPGCPAGRVLVTGVCVLENCPVPEPPDDAPCRVTDDVAGSCDRAGNCLAPCPVATPSGAPCPDPGSSASMASACAMSASSPTPPAQRPIPTTPRSATNRACATRRSCAPAPSATPPPKAAPARAPTPTPGSASVASACPRCAIRRSLDRAARSTGRPARAWPTTSAP